MSKNEMLMPIGSIKLVTMIFRMVKLIIRVLLLRMIVVVWLPVYGVVGHAKGVCWTSETLQRL